MSQKISINSTPNLKKTTQSKRRLGPKRIQAISFNRKMNSRHNAFVEFLVKQSSHHQSAESDSITLTYSWSDLLSTLRTARQAELMQSHILIRCDATVSLTALSTLRTARRADLSISYSHGTLSPRMNYYRHRRISCLVRLHHPSACPVTGTRKAGRSPLSGRRGRRIFSNRQACACANLCSQTLLYFPHPRSFSQKN